MDPEKQIDAALDSALARYGQAEPRSGLEGRVLANLRAAGERRNARHGWWPAWRVITAILVAAILVIGAAIFVGRKRGSRTEVAIERAPVVEQVLPAPVVSVAGAGPLSSRKIARRVQALQSPEARLDRFPSPQPLSEQEQMLARYVEELPSEAKQLAQAQTDLAQEELREFEEQAAMPPRALPQ